MEGVFSIFLFGLFLIVFSQMITGSQRLVRHADGRASSLKVCQWALMELRREVQGAVKVVDPAPTSSGSILKLNTFAGDAASRLPDMTVRGFVLPSVWYPDAPGDLVTLTFQENNGLLERAKAGTVVTIARNLESFSVEHKETQLEIQLELQESGRNVQFTSRVELP